MKIQKKTCFTVCAVSLAIGQAWAQQSQAADGSAILVGQDKAVERNQTKLPDVNVTATRRLTAASATPLSLTVMDGDDLRNAGATNAAILTELAPNVQIGASNGAMNITIRGVSSNDTSEKGDPSASFNVDGINLARPQAAGLAFYDLERIEVLRGPQGTLYGRNSTAGAVNLVSAKPGKKLTGRVGIDTGNYGYRMLDGMINVPVSDSLAIRAAVQGVDHEGYIGTTSLTTGKAFPNGRDDQNDFSGRVHALVTLTPDTSVLLTLDSSKMKGHSEGSIDASSYLANRDKRESVSAIAGRRDNKSDGATVEAKTKLGESELVYLYGHRTFEIDSESSLGAAPATSISKAKFVQTSHELRLASGSSSPFQWLAGLYAFNESGQSLFNVFNAVPFGDGSLKFDQDPANSKSTAVFGQASYAFTPETKVTVGLRSTNDEKSRKGINTVAGFIVTPNDASVSYSQTNYKLGVDHRLSSNLLVYGDISTGYKAGGFNDGVASSNPDLVYKPEHLTAYEAGVKGKFMDGAGRINASIFWYDYQDLQVSAVSAITNNLTTTNAARAKVTGAEVESRVNLTQDDRIDFSVGLLNAEYREYLPLAGVNWSGQSLDKSPKAVATLGYSHFLPLAGGLLEAHIDLRYSASYRISDFTSATSYEQPAYTNTNLRLTWTSGDEKWLTEVYGRNLSDNKVLTGFTFGTFSLYEPKRYGIRVSRSF
ncbi:MAG: hypothetical protein CFE43_16950 [Burkholderiales bacterium PBB3]|nr:MAG: hypothetical protein CFE43_16950 [Burkholderiales bacterium PBB3]